MFLRKCPKCEINYITENETVCSVCRREASGDAEQYDMIELCSECGENPVVPGKELCAECLKELQRRSQETQDDGMPRTANVGIDSVSTMDEIELDIPDEMDSDFSDEGEADADDENSPEDEEYDN